MTFDQTPMEIAGLLLLLAASAFFSSSETALLALNRIRLTYLAGRNRPGAKELEKLLNPPDDLITAILVGNNLVNIAASVFATTFFMRIFGRYGNLLTIVILTPALLIFSEIIPKVFAASHPEAIAFRVLRPLQGVMLVMKPVLWAIGGLNRLLARFLGKSGETAVISEEEIRTMIAVGEKSGVVAKEKRKMLHGIFELSKTYARDVMVPRIEVIGIEVNTPYEEVLQIVREEEHSRYPVFEESLDNICGVVHAMDIFQFVGNPEQFSLRKIVRKPYFVPESKPIEAMLESFRDRRLLMAVVIDEYGGMEGIVTLEDIFEEIVGEIHDEHDLVDEEVPVRELEPGRFLVDGATPIHAINRKFGLNLSERHANTMAGFIMELIGSIPHEGDQCQFENIVFRVAKLSDRRIEEIEMTLPVCPSHEAFCAPLEKD
ncbi:MAG: DUF21 domain-containing protein [Deltaproteobacteria bacterium]|nr:DUF21 domain-containing protein [Deltaproteobacteria bacterium]